VNYQLLIIKGAYSSGTVQELHLFPF